MGLVSVGLSVSLWGDARRAQSLQAANDSLSIAISRMHGLEERIQELEQVEGKIRGLLSGDVDDPGDVPPDSMDESIESAIPTRPSGPWRATQPSRLPCDGPISRGFRQSGPSPHLGVDIPGRIGTPVLASGGGIVKSVGREEVFGEVVILDHGGGVETLYGHNEKVLVAPGDSIRAGQVVALLGNTGQSSAPHVHFEVRVDGKATDPGAFVPELHNRN
ncbi:MAG: M23 family metallopeptidase [Candidatus Eisenbacteria bacterium]